MKRLRDLEAVGWGFWTICFVLLLAPAIVFVYFVTFDTASHPTRIATGVFVAAIAAAFVAWGANAALHRRNLRRYEQERKSQRKAKKSGKKKR